jgi:Tol biopolymer transport system component
VIAQLSILSALTSKMLNLVLVSRLLLLGNIEPGVYPQQVAQIPVTQSAGLTGLASVASNGQQGNADSGLIRIRAVPGNYVADPPAISGDGRYVAFVSDASNLSPNSSPGGRSVYVRDRLTVQTTRVSEAQDGTEADGDSSSPAMSADGRYIAFISSASNLLAGSWNGWLQVFLRDQQTHQLTLLSKDSNGTPWIGGTILLALSGNGRYAAFRSNTYYNPSLILYDIWSSTIITTIMSFPQRASLSFDGSYMAFMASSDLLPGGQTSYDVYVYDREIDSTQRVSVSAAGVPGNSMSGDPAISADGRYVVFVSSASNLASCEGNCSQDVFIHDLMTNKTDRVLLGIDGLSANESSYSPSVSGDGRSVAFMSAATNLVAGSKGTLYNAYIIDRFSGNITRISDAFDGSPSNGDSHMPVISSNGRFVAFDSFASDLIAGDVNGYPDVFVHDLGLPLIITGRLTTNDGKPISAATVYAISDTSTNNLWITSTDASGFYTFTISASGTFTITPQPAKFTFAPDSYAYSPAWLQVKASSDATDQNFTGVPIQNAIAVRPLRQVDLPWGKHHLVLLCLICAERATV